MMLPLTCLTWQMLKASLMEMLQICFVLRKMLMVMHMNVCGAVVKSQSAAVLVLWVEFWCITGAVL